MMLKPGDMIVTEAMGHPGENALMYPDRERKDHTSVLTCGIVIACFNEPYEFTFRDPNVFVLDSISMCCGWTYDSWIKSTNV